MAGSPTAEQAESFLVEQVVVHDPEALSHLGRHLRHVLDTGTGDTLADHEQHLVATRSLQIRDQPTAPASSAAGWTPSSPTCPAPG